MLEGENSRKLSGLLNLNFDIISNNRLGALEKYYVQFEL